MLDDIADHQADYEPIVTIQFGHNDQKSTSGISLEEFGENLKGLAMEVVEAGGTPVGGILSLLLYNSAIYYVFF